VSPPLDEDVSGRRFDKSAPTRRKEVSHRECASASRKFPTLTDLSSYNTLPTRLSSFTNITYMSELAVDPGPSFGIVFCAADFAGTDLNLLNNWLPQSSAASSV